MNTPTARLTKVLQGLGYCVTARHVADSRVTSDPYLRCVQ